MKPNPDTGQRKTPDFIEAIITCKGNYYDPDFPSELALFKRKLNHLLKTENGASAVIKKVEPWNSVKVTLNIPAEAAARLRQLASQHNGSALTSLGIMAIQFEGDRIISLTLAGNKSQVTRSALGAVIGQDGDSNPNAAASAHNPNHNTVPSTSSMALFNNLFQNTLGMSSATSSQPIVSPLLTMVPNSMLTQPSQQQRTVSPPLSVASTSTTEPSTAQPLPNPLQKPKPEKRRRQHTKSPNNLSSKRSKPKAASPVAPLSVPGNGIPLQHPALKDTGKTTLEEIMPPSLVPRTSAHNQQTYDEMMANLMKQSQATLKAITSKPDSIPSNKSPLRETEMKPPNDLAFGDAGSSSSPTGSPHGKNPKHTLELEKELSDLKLTNSSENVPSESREDAKTLTNPPNHRPSAGVMDVDQAHSSLARSHPNGFPLALENFDPDVPCDLSAPSERTTADDTSKQAHHSEQTERPVIGVFGSVISDPVGSNFDPFDSSWKTASSSKDLKAVVISPDPSRGDDKDNQPVNLTMEKQIITPMNTLPTSSQLKDSVESKPNQGVPLPSPPIEGPDTANQRLTNSETNQESVQAEAPVLAEHVSVIRAPPSHHHERVVSPFITKEISEDLSIVREDRSSGESIDFPLNLALESSLTNVDSEPVLPPPAPVQIETELEPCLPQAPPDFSRAVLGQQDLNDDMPTDLTMQKPDKADVSPVIASPLESMEMEPAPVICGKEMPETVFSLHVQTLPNSPQNDEGSKSPEEVISPKTMTSVEEPGSKESDLTETKLIQTAVEVVDKCSDHPLVEDRHNPDPFPMMPGVPGHLRVLQSVEGHEPGENGSSTSTDSGVVAGSPKSDICPTPPHSGEFVYVIRADHPLEEASPSQVTPPEPPTMVKPTPSVPATPTIPTTTPTITPLRPVQMLSNMGSINPQNPIRVNPAASTITVSNGPTKAEMHSTHHPNAFYPQGKVSAAAVLQLAAASASKQHAAVIQRAKDIAHTDQAAPRVTQVVSNKHISIGGHRSVHLERSIIKPIAVSASQSHLKSMPLIIHPSLVNKSTNRHSADTHRTTVIATNTASTNPHTVTHVIASPSKAARLQLPVSGSPAARLAQVIIVPGAGNHEKRYSTGTSFLTHSSPSIITSVPRKLHPIDISNEAITIATKSESSKPAHTIININGKVERAHAPQIITTINRKHASADQTIMVEMNDFPTQTRMAKLDSEVKEIKTGSDNLKLGNAEMEKIDCDADRLRVNGLDEDEQVEAVKIVDEEAKKTPESVESEKEPEPAISESSVTPEPSAASNLAQPETMVELTVETESHVSSSLSRDSPLSMASPDSMASSTATIVSPGTQLASQRKSSRVKNVKSAQGDEAASVQTTSRARKRTSQESGDETKVAVSQKEKISTANKEQTEEETEDDEARDDLTELRSAENEPVQTGRTRGKRSTRSSGSADLLALPTVYRERKRSKR